jgi:hypothetical protein
MMTPFRVIRQHGVPGSMAETVYIVVAETSQGAKEAVFESARASLDDSFAVQQIMNVEVHRIYTLHRNGALT